MKLFLVLLSFFLFNSSYAEDNQIFDIEKAWNGRDIETVQNNFSKDAPYYQATFAAYAEKGGLLTVINSKTVSYKTVAALVILDNNKEVWLFRECSISKEWCWWDKKKVGIFGSAELSQGLDLATTGYAISELGFTEANPLGLGIIVPAKIGLTTWTHYMNYDECVSWRTGLDMVGLGAGLANIASILGSPPVGALVVLASSTLFRYDSANYDAKFDCAQYVLLEDY